ncbi:MAG: hypothetical protein R2799_06945 [Crocinitomicaceae bacterium]
MKTLLLILPFLFVGQLIAQNEEDIVKDIRKKYAEARANYSKYTKKTVEMMDESTEGGQIVAFSDASEIKLLEIEWSGEMGRRTIEYYFHNGELYFAFEQIYNYNAPIYYDMEMAKENGDEPHDPSKTTVKANRYYFHNNHLIRWLDPEKNKVDVKTEEAVATGKELLSDSSIKKDKCK